MQSMVQVAPAAAAADFAPPTRTEHLARRRIRQMLPHAFPVQPARMD